MKTIEQRYSKVLDGTWTVAVVVLEIGPNHLENHRVIIDTEKRPFKSQGLIEGGHENWNKSAKRALEAAVEQSDNSPKLDIRIKKLKGRIFLDTNNASVGIACILALWQYLDWQPAQGTMDKIHQFVKEDWKNKVDVIPDFGELLKN